MEGVGMAIEVSYISREKRQYSCDNCNRETPFVLQYSFKNSKGKEFNKLTLCEDCSCALAHLHFKCMEHGESYQYDKDGFLKEEI
jgi:hypothetical protein